MSWILSGEDTGESVLLMVLAGGPYGENRCCERPLLSCGGYSGRGRAGDVPCWDTVAAATALLEAAAAATRC